MNKFFVGAVLVIALIAVLQRYDAAQPVLGHLFTWSKAISAATFQAAENIWAEVDK